MKRTTIIVQALLISMGCAVLLAAVSWLGGEAGEAAPANAALLDKHEQPVELNHDNLVDELIAWKLLVPVAKVELSGSVLSLDFRITEGADQPDRLYQGLAQAIDRAFAGTSNVHRLLVRFIAEDRWLGNKYLLLAADVRRGEWPKDALEELRTRGDLELSHELKRWFRVTETSLWKTMIHK
ncbi:hypothetical protein MKX50_14965 [Paenibacillus sp. FSL W8-0186]|uniref:Uncharacterized protein n=1 Tax=Paenibacillus woosongensis TaxID=307580 RepID=A0ABQ4MQB2_9BACL|nr:hypothetical protein [Paenibacillus woosongensis]GIP58191.1 hypothetical protein J15TS10_20050 [Paenibacillus woosongensis]